MNSYLHDPDAVLDYEVDWSDWLADGDTVDTHTVAVDGVTLDTSSATDTAVTVWLSGGTAGTTATATVHVSTAQGREDDRTIHLIVRER